jgi:23S rRNA (guanosine2251-2'-O)-methyltransferase
LHNGVIAKVDPLSIWSMSALLRKLNGQEGDPFLLLADTIAYEQNLGAILRTGLGFGLDGLVIPTRRGAPVSSVAQRVAMGGAEEVHIVKEGLLSAMKQISREGIPIIGADGRGEPVTEVDLTGPLALVVGSEGSGMSSKVRERCDRLVAIPTMGDLESFNVSVATAIVMYERMRQYGEKG